MGETVDEVVDDVVLLPIGATEAHGPHLPLDTDTRIAIELARRCHAALTERGHVARIANSFTDTAAQYAASFPGTRHVDPQKETELLLARIRQHLDAPPAKVVLINLHFDPAHMAAVKAALAQLQPPAAGKVVWPNFTRRAHAQEIGGEFATGACHAGEFETSLMLAASGPLAVDGRFRDLPEVNVDLAAAIRAGKRNFEEAGVTRAYCGHPATATREEGERLYGVLTRIVLAHLDLA